MRQGSANSTREVIGRAARRMFYEQGYAGTSLRRVAAAAGVDPALVIRHYGSKEGLFLETVGIEGGFERLVDGPLEGLGHRLVRALLTDLRQPTFEVWRVMVRASDSEPVRERLVAIVEQIFLAPIAPRLQGPRAGLRARLVAAQISGLLDAAAILHDPWVAEADVEDLVELYGGAIQTLLDPPS